MKRHKLPAGRRARGLLLLPLLGALLFAAAVGALARQQPDAPVTAAAVPHLANEKPHFYITNFSVQGAGADTSCAAGYHMASLWEIFDPSARTYANLPVAKTRTDQGSGPVAGWWGWVRTGYDSSVQDQAGRANCSLWSSSTAGEYGTIVKLTDNWTAAAQTVNPWQPQTWSCAGTAPVWCVSDPIYGAFVPIMAKQ
jgi:hypothetical protein